MIIENTKIGDYYVWLVVEQLVTYSADKKFIETKNEYLCYFKLSEPTPFIYGELLKDKENKPMLFFTKDEAITEAIKIIKIKLYP